jgi:hypothetical protein
VIGKEDDYAGKTNAGALRIQDQFGGIDKTLQPLINSGDYKDAFATAANQGRFDALTNQNNLRSLIKAPLTAQQMSDFYTAFMPYEQQMAGKPSGYYLNAPGKYQGQPLTWGTNLNNAQDVQQAVQWNMDNSLYGGIPDPSQVLGSHPRVDPTAVQALEDIGKYVVLPTVTAAVGAGAFAGLGTVGQAGVGATVGAANAAANGGNPLIGAVAGGVGASGAGISEVSGLSPAVSNVIAKTAAGGISGGVTGAEAGAAGAVVGAGFQQAGAPAFLGSAASSAVSNYIRSQGDSGAPTTGTNGAGQPTGSSFIVPAATGLAGMASTNTMQAGGPGGDPRLGTTVEQPPDTSGGAASGAGGTSGGTDLSGLSSLLGSLGISSGGLSSAAPYLLSGGLGLYQAAQANAQNKQAVSDFSNLGKPYTQAGNQLLTQAQSGKLDSAHQNVVNTLQSQGQQLIDSASPLSQIANSAFADYQAGRLNPAQQEQIDAWTRSAKQELRQTLASSGISDSSILASQDAAIDSQATQLKANLMTQNLQLGDQQYSQWLTSTQAGQQLIAQGAQYAATSIDTMLSQALGLGGLGTGIQAEAIKLGLQQDQILSKNVSDLMKSITSAYAVANKPAGVGAGSGGSGGVVGGAASKAAGAAGSAAGLYSAGSAALARLTGGNQALINQNGNIPGEPGNIQAQDPNQLQVPDINSTISGMDTSFGGDGSYSMNADNTVDTSTFNNYFYDPGTSDLPDINFGD